MFAGIRAVSTTSPSFFWVERAKALNQELEIANNPATCFILPLVPMHSQHLPSWDTGQKTGQVSARLVSTATDHSANRSDLTLGSDADKPQGAGITV